MTTYTLTQDNGGSNPEPYRFQKLSASIEDHQLAHHLRRHYRWRKDVTYERLMREGSHSWDRFIYYLRKEGYGSQGVDDAW